MARKNRKEYNEYMRKYMLRRYHKRRKEALAYLGGACELCGSEKELEIDHVDRSQKSFPVSRLWSVAEKRFWEEIEKCQILCKECHQEKSIKDLGFQKNKGVHGHPMNYKRYGCRCKKCSRAYKEYNRKQWKKGSVA